MKPTKSKGPTNVDEYIAQQPAAVQARVRRLRKTIRAAAPGADERISYQMPAYKLHTNLIHFAAWKNHIGLYPTSSGLRAFAAELADYVCSKGAIQFPHDQPIPWTLVRRIVEFRVNEDQARPIPSKSRSKKTESRKPRNGTTRRPGRKSTGTTPTTRPST